MAASHTTNLGLNKPDRQDFVSVVIDINDNMDIIDSAVGDINSSIKLPTVTSVSTLDAIKSHILSMHSDMSVGETRQDYLEVVVGYTDGAFIEQTRYWGTYAKINSVQGAATYKSRRGDEIVIGVNNTSTTPVWNIDSVALVNKTSSISITNQYSTVLAAINAYRNVMNYPFTIQKNGTSSYTDIPSDIANDCEWSVLCIGNSIRTTALLTIYTGAGDKNRWLYVANIYEGSYIGNWISADSIINSTSYEQLSLQTGITGNFRIGRVGKYRVATGAVKASGAGTNILLLTLQSSDRPPYEIDGACTGYSVGGQCEIVVNATGNVVLNVPSGATNNTVKFNVSWLVS